MSDPFPSTYTKDYKWWENVRRPPTAKGFNIAFNPQRNEKFLKLHALKPSTGEEAKILVRNLHRLRMKSTYTVDYCEERFPKADVPRDSLDPADPLKDDELMDSMARALHPEPRKLLPPPDTTPVVLAFCPVRRFQTGRTLYADLHSRPAYEALKRGILERGRCRLAAAPLTHFEPDYSSPPCLQGKSPPPPTWIHLKPEP